MSCCFHWIASYIWYKHSKIFVQAVFFPLKFLDIIFQMSSPDSLSIPLSSSLIFSVWISLLSSAHVNIPELSFPVLPLTWNRPPRWKKSLMKRNLYHRMIIVHTTTLFKSYQIFCAVLKLWPREPDDALLEEFQKPYLRLLIVCALWPSILSNFLRGDIDIILPPKIPKG